MTLDYDDITNAVSLTDENGEMLVEEQKDWLGRLKKATQYLVFTNKYGIESEGKRRMEMQKKAVFEEQKTMLSKIRKRSKIEIV